jgi:hypothetical protein
LDADLLDGQHGTYYYAASNPNGYTTNTGTVTSITVSAGTGLSGGGTVTTSGTVTLNLSTPVTVANGGTGATSFTAGYVLFGNGTSAINTSGNLFWDNSNARLGIASTSPEAKLHVLHNGSNGAAGRSDYGVIAYATSGQATLGAEFGGDGYANLNLGSVESGTRYFWHISKRVASDGRRLEFYFHNASGFASKGYLDTSGNLLVIGNVTAYGSTSDARLKHNVKPIENALSTVIELKGVTFNWNKDTTTYTLTKLDKDIGFIAQQVQEVLPDLVREGEDGYLGIRDRAIIPLLVEAIKELNKKIETLEGEKTK